MDTFCGIIPVKRELQPQRLQLIVPIFEVMVG